MDLMTLIRAEECTRAKLKIEKKRPTYTPAQNKTDYPNLAFYKGPPITNVPISDYSITNLPNTIKQLPTNTVFQFINVIDASQPDFRLLGISNPNDILYQKRSPPKLQVLNSGTSNVNSYAYQNGSNNNYFARNIQPAFKLSNTMRDNNLRNKQQHHNDVEMNQLIDLNDEKTQDLYLNTHFNLPIILNIENFQTRMLDVVCDNTIIKFNKELDKQLSPTHMYPTFNDFIRDIMNELNIIEFPKKQDFENLSNPISISRIVKYCIYYFMKKFNTNVYEYATHDMVIKFVHDLVDELKNMLAFYERNNSSFA